MVMETVETDRLVLRNWRDSDSVDMFEYASTNLVGPSAGWKPHRNEEESKSIIRMFIKANNVYAIELKSSNKVIGRIGIHNKAPDEKLKDLNQREIGYVLNSEYWGNGYVPEAVNRLLDYGFNNMNLDLIWCAHFDENLKSKRVNEKCGFQYQFSKMEKLPLLDDKEVKVLYYNQYK